MTAAGTGAYNKAVTGRPFVFPHQLYQKTQMATPLFMWEPLKSIQAYKNPALKRFQQEWFVNYYLRKKTWKYFWIFEGLDVGKSLRFYFGYILALPVLCLLPALFSDNKRLIRFSLVLLIFAITCAVETAHPVQTHYFSSFVSLAVLLVVLGLMSMAVLLGQKGIRIVYLLLAAQLLLNVMSLAIPRFSMESHGSPAQGQGLDPLKSYTREEVKNLLMQKGGKHLVLISYTPNRVFYNEWVFNGADIDRQLIVWARSMDKESDDQLIEYFADRRIWRITVNDEHFPPPRSYDQR
jgi:hypothetical protein